MGLFDRFKKAKEENNPIHDTSSMEEELGELYNKLANKIVSIIPTEWDEFHYLGEVEEKLFGLMKPLDWSLKRELICGEY